MGEQHEGQEQPVDDAATTEADGRWRNVPRPTTEELLAPSAQVMDAPSIPALVKVVGILVIVVLLVLSVLLGLSLGNAGGGPSPSPSVEPLWPLEAPTVVKDFVRGEVVDKPGATPDDRGTVTAHYADGKRKIVLLLSRPETNLDEYLMDAGMEGAQEMEGSPGTRCGTQEDTSLPVCARIVDETAISIAGLSEQDFPTLTQLVDDFYQELQ